MKYNLNLVLEKLENKEKSLKNICEELNYPYKYISRLLVQSNKSIKDRKINNISKKDINLIYEDFSNGFTMSDLESKYGYSESTLKKYFNIYGYKITHKCKLVKELNHNFFKIIDTEEKAYLLGFFAADGTINKTGNGMAVLIQKDDVEILDYYKKAFNSQKDYYHYPAKKETHKDRLKIVINSKINKQNLINLGFPCRKTYNLFSLPNKIMKESLWPHFIRGYFDGDGSIILPTKNSRNTVFKITSTNKEFLLFCYNIFEKLGCTNINIEERDNNAAFNLIVKNRNYILLIKEYLYKNSNFYLKRKKDKIFNVAPVIRNNDVKNP